jgi:hypothetical protein
LLSQECDGLRLIVVGQGARLTCSRRAERTQLAFASPIGALDGDASRHSPSGLPVSAPLASALVMCREIPNFRLRHFSPGFRFASYRIKHFLEEKHYVPRVCIRSHWTATPHLTAQCTK